MSKETFLKYANSSQQNKKRCFALRDWCRLQGDGVYSLIEVFDAIERYCSEDKDFLGTLIDLLTSKKKVYGRSNVVFGGDGKHMGYGLGRDENGKVYVVGYRGGNLPQEKGQHLTHDPKVLRNDGQMKKNVIKSREKLYDLGEVVRNIYKGESNEFITCAMAAIKGYAKSHKVSEMSVADKLKKGTHQLDTSNGIENAIIRRGGKTVKLNESQLNEIENATKLTEYKFYNNVQRFLSDLLKDPVGAKVPFILQANNIARNYLLYHLKSQGIINRHQKISDTDSQGNPKTAKMIIKYSVPKKDFAKKMKKLFIAMVAKNVPEKVEKIISECDGGGGAIGGDAAGATSADASGQFSQPLFGVQRRKMPSELEEDTTTSSVGNYQYTVPFASDKETRDRTPGFSVERQDETTLNEAMGSNFNLEDLYLAYEKDLEENKSFSRIGDMRSYYGNCVSYCRQTLGEEIGRGASRMVFQIDDTRVLKLAQRKWGEKQNEDEYKSFKNFPNKSIFTNIFNDSDTDNFLFLVSEYALPAEEKDFINLYGVKFQDWVCELCYAIEDNDYEKINEFTEIASNKSKELLELTNEIYYACQNGLYPSDIDRIEQWGMVKRDGKAKLVIVDYGLVN